MKAFKKGIEDPLHSKKGMENPHVLQPQGINNWKVLRVLLNDQMI